MADQEPNTDHINLHSYLSDDHLRQDDDTTHESEPPSFRHLSFSATSATPRPCYSRDTFTNIYETFPRLSNASAPANNGILLSPQSTPPQSPRSRWSFSSPPRTSISSHHPPPLSRCCVLTLRHHDGNIHSIVVTRGLVFTGSTSSYIRAWQQTDCVEKGYVKSQSGEVRSMLAHGNMLFTTHKDNKIRVWNISSPATSGPCNTCDVDNYYIRPQKITTLPKSSPLRFLFPKTKAQIHRDIVSCLAYNWNEGILYTGSYDKTVKAWRLSDSKCIDSFAAHADNINAMVINEEGYLFTCSSDGTVKMWSKVSGETFHTLTMTLHFQTHPIYTLALSEASLSEGSILYSGSSEGCIYFWEKQISGEYKRRGCIQGHQFGVLCLTAIDDLVISGSADCMIKIWKRGNDWKDGVMVNVTHECVSVLEGHKGPVKCVAACLEDDVSFVRGFLVFSAGLDQTFKVWKVKVLQESTMIRTTQLSDNADGEDHYVDDEVEIVTPVLSPSWVKMVQRDG
ncbi:protein JINGUBANG-like [Silene latifolia]|uniref:protein JINGUBANG-like n=1 Tax=Silene latifolia TaxID=37657 RepID=UPI003D784118